MSDPSPSKIAPEKFTMVELAHKETSSTEEEWKSTPSWKIRKPRFVQFRLVTYPLLGPRQSQAFAHISLSRTTLTILALPLLHLTNFTLEVESQLTNHTGSMDQPPEMISDTLSFSSSRRGSESENLLPRFREPSPALTLIANRSYLSALDPKLVSDFTLGLADGLTVPFALTAGLSRLGVRNVVIVGGLTELVAGMVSMGFGAFLGAHSEAAAYASQLRATTNQVRRDPIGASERVRTALSDLDLPVGLEEQIAHHINEDPTRQTSYIMRSCYGTHEPGLGRAIKSGLTVGSGYFVGGILPMIPYFVEAYIDTAFWWSLGLTCLILLLFGSIKTMLVETEEGDDQPKRVAWMRYLWHGLLMVCLGGAAVGTAVGVAEISRHWAD